MIQDLQLSLSMRMHSIWVNTATWWSRQQLLEQGNKCTQAWPLTSVKLVASCLKWGKKKTATCHTHTRTEGVEQVDQLAWIYNFEGPYPEYLWSLLPLVRITKTAPTFSIWPGPVTSFVWSWPQQHRTKLFPLSWRCRNRRSCTAGMAKPVEFHLWRSLQWSQCWN